MPLEGTQTTTTSAPTGAGASGAPAAGGKATPATPGAGSATTPPSTTSTAGAAAKGASSPPAGAANPKTGTPGDGTGSADVSTEPGKGDGAGEGKDEKRVTDAWGKIAAAQKKLDTGAATLKRERETFEKTKADHDQAIAPYRKAAELLKAGKNLEAWEALGGKYADLTAEVVKRPKPNPEAQRALDEVQKLRQEQADRDAKARNDAEAKQLADFRDEIAEHLSTSGEKYEVLNSFGATEATDLVFKMIRAHAIATKDEPGGPEVLTFEAAATTLEEKLTERARKLSALKKLQAGSPPTTRTLDATSTAPRETRGDQAAAADGPRTLSNGHAAEATSRSAPGGDAPTPRPSRWKTERETIARAAQKIGQKK